MSFFDEIFNQFDVNDCENEIFVSMILNKGVSIVGKIKIVSFDESEIILSSKNKLIKTKGSDLKIKSAARGDLFIVGNVKSICLE